MASMAMNEPLRWLVCGAGAVGTYVGGSLALTGQQVVFLARPSVAPELSERGLRLNLYGRQAILEGPVVRATLAEAMAQGPYNAAILALKAYDTVSFLEAFEQFKEKAPAMLCLQNGVENETLLESVLGPGKVLAGTVTSSIRRRAVGDIVLERLRGIGIAYDHPLSNLLVDSFNQAGLNARSYSHPAEMKWSKLLTNLLANASSAILNMTPEEIFAHPRLHELEMRQLREALAVMAAQNLQPVDLPGTPVKALSFAVRRLPFMLSRPLMQRAVGKGRGAKLPSLHIDLHTGRSQSEVNQLNGAVVRYGERLGVPTPINRLLTNTLCDLVAGRQPIEAYSKRPEKLIAQL
jgi:2-dehydropantoate 2-reductase